MRVTSAIRFRSTRARRIAAVTITAGVGIGVTFGAGVSNAAPAHPKTQTLHFLGEAAPFSYVIEGTTVIDNPTQNPAPGDVEDDTNYDFAGNYLHHAKHWSATDNLMCFITGRGTGTCFDQLTIGKSEILSEGPLSMSPTEHLVIYGGTGAYEGVTGTLTAVNEDLSSELSPTDATLTFSRP
jgi:hypothetical protein